MPTRVLIVDDNALFLDAAAELLEREGMDVVGTASSSAEAIRLAGELRPDVMLVDVDLGPEDGFELARALSKGAPAASKVILVSTHSEEELSDLIAASPALGFIHKTRLSARAIDELVD
jgi:DNA-binding NarL/FixJ family response regulator